MTRPPSPGQAILLEAFVAARRDPEVAELLRQILAERASRLGGMVDASKQSGLIDPDIDTASVVHLAHAVGLGFLLFEAVGFPNPAPGDWDAVIDRVIGSMAAPTPTDPLDSLDLTTPPIVIPRIVTHP